MPILWRFLIQNFLQVFLLCVAAFIAILLTTRLEEIAHFASFGADLKLIGMFALFQIPYILPIALPISCLISSILLMSRLSKDHELTALRSAGLSLKEIAAPLVFTSIFLALFNFYTVSELATLSHLKANTLKSELRSINPLLLLHNKHLMRAKGIYYDALGASKMGQSASDVIIAMPDQKNQSLNLIIAKQLDTDNEEFKAKQLTLLTQIDNDSGSGYPSLLLENIGSSSSKIEDFSHLIQKKISQVSSDNLNIGMLRMRLADYELQLETIEPNPVNEPLLKYLRKSVRQIYSEVARRFSAGLAPFTFTLLGLAFGMSISRTTRKIEMLFPILLAALFLISFFAAKSLDSQTGLSYALYLVPHALIAAAAVYKLERISHGVG